MSKRRVSSILKGDARMDGESFEDFKIRRKAEKLLVKNYLKGSYTDINHNSPKENLTSWK